MKNKPHKSAEPQRSFLEVLKKSSLAFLSMTPLFAGVIGLVGLFQTLVSAKTLVSFFKGDILIDTFTGTITGAFAVGNPVISYLLGGELLDHGISLYAVTAFILSWVTLGLVHLPAEAEVFGAKFTLLRNILAFFFTMLIAILTTSTVHLLS
ncbi:permease [Desulforhopalus singaporensis]|uniref:Permease n=1 Tax=Desulforhopalus singaporensis TaxID=91360 RepID=A0A1H0NPN8_9BACT|nr:permease [Desulforhopalus singaporensis]SDO94732.1 hypothetical protein SAMN05660330_01395 [Desulforhopalus singaporensis]